ncbi:MAG: MiaB/RimO family radical SAM methylthiotransferase, partial [bacterium]
RIPYLNLVCGTYSIPKIHELVRDLLKTGGEPPASDKGGRAGRRIDTSEDIHDFPPPVYEARDSKISAWVAIMKGCNNYCSYCVVPYLRGREISRPLEEIENEVKELARKGIKEVTLLGQNVNSYKSSQHSAFSSQKNFASLLARINNIDGIKRIRFMTSHPKDMSSVTIEAVRDLPKVCKHVHLALQSGSDRILKLMNRKYTRNQYQELVDRIRQTVPDVSITTDIMVGFPTESEEDFMDTYNLFKEMEFDASYVFKYSPRPGTKAAEMEDDVTEEIKKERLNKLLSMQKRIAQKKNEPE